MSMLAPARLRVCLFICRALYSGSIAMLLQDTHSSSPAAMQGMNNLAMQLRKVCNHPVSSHMALLAYFWWLVGLIF